MLAYRNEVAEVRSLLDGRYHDVKSGRLATVEGSFFERWRQREDELCKRRPPK